MSTLQVAQGLQSINAMDDEGVKALQDIVESLSPSSFSPEVYRAVFGVFERFPDHDGFGLFWTLLHLMEKTQGYEPFLVESVQRAPVEFNLAMVNRLLNGGVSSVGDLRLLLVLEQAANNTDAPEVSREWAREFLTYQQRAQQAVQADGPASGGSAA